MKLHPFNGTPAQTKAIIDLWQAYADFFELQTQDADYYNGEYQSELKNVLSRNHSGEHLFLFGNDAAGANKADFIGMGIIRNLSDDVCELKRFILREGSRGQGHGATLLDLFCTQAQQLGYGRIELDVLSSKSIAAQALYAKSGFTAFKFESYLAENDVIYMAKQLNDPAIK